MIDSEELSRLFAAERAVRPPSSALEHGLARFLPAVAAHVAPVPVASAALKVTWTAVSKWILAGFVVGVVGSGAAARMWMPAAPRVEAQRPLTPVVAAKKAAAPASIGVPTVAWDSPAPSAAPSSAPRNAPHLAPAAAPASSAEPSRFDAELRLITLAKAELDGGRPHLAKAWLAERAERFPRGVFATDAEALGVLIRCGEKRDEAAARRFAEAHPTSPMLERLRRACGVIENHKSVNEQAGPAEPTHEEVGK